MKDSLWEGSSDLESKSSPWLSGARAPAEACTVALSPGSSECSSNMQDLGPPPRPTESESASNKIHQIHFEKFCSRSIETV